MSSVAPPFSGRRAFMLTSSYPEAGVKIAPADEDQQGFLSCRAASPQFRGSGSGEGVQGLSLGTETPFWVPFSFSKSKPSPSVSTLGKHLWFLFIGQHPLTYREIIH